MTHCVLFVGSSRSFPESHPLVSSATADSDVLVIIGAEAGPAYRELRDKARYRVIAVELGTECLGEHLPGTHQASPDNVLGFARFRMGTGTPSNLVEVVRHSSTPHNTINTACALFEAYGLKTAVCGDFAGRIVDRLLRPYLNAALERLDAGLASAEDLDLTLKLGLGYPEGPIEWLERTGLSAHHDIATALYRALANSAYAPPRRAQIAKAQER
jgi:3-hydroxybutyryl-CoA dehydrogenase